MTGFLDNKLKELSDTVIDYYIYDILDIFNEEFGEENVELKKKVNYFYKDLSDSYLYRKIGEDKFEFISYTSLQYQEDVEESYTVLEYFEKFGETEDTWNTINIDIEKIRLYFRHFVLEYTYIILVRFPEVIVKNEYGKSTKIKNFFAKVAINNNSTLRYTVKFNRSHYTYEHFINNYMHSHISGILKSDFEQFRDACFGTGPILTTMECLYTSNEKEQWMQFCWDLAKYVTIESKEGGPYRYLEKCTSSFENSRKIFLPWEAISINSSKPCSIYKVPLKYLYEFTLHLINNKVIKFAFDCGQWVIAQDYVEYCTLLSTEFLKWYNTSEIKSEYNIEYLFAQEILQKCIIIDNCVYAAKDNMDVDSYRGKHVLDFKGRSYFLEIDAPLKGNEHNVNVLINPRIINNINYILLMIINTKYGREKFENNEPELPFDNIG